MKRLIKSIKVRWFSMYSAVGVSLTITTFCFFSDILGVLNIMNKAFQNNLKFSTVNMLISSIIRRIQQEFEAIERIKEGPSLSKFLKEYNEKGTFQGFCFIIHNIY